MAIRDLTWRSLVCLGLLFVFLYVCLASPVSVKAASFDQEMRSGYASMPRELPDDTSSYPGDARYVDLRPKSSINDGWVGRQMTGGGHQYITVGGGNVNDGGGNTPGNYYRTAGFVVYTDNPGTKTISFDFVSRGVNVDNTVARCDSTLKVSAINQTSGGVDEDNVSTSGECPRSGSTRVLESRHFARITSVDAAGISHGSPIYKAYIYVRLVNANVGQASFRIHTQSDARIGYQAWTDFNAYGTKLADGHSLSFKWRPPCGATSNNYNYNFNYSDGNEDDSPPQVVQPQSYGANLEIIRSGALIGTHEFLSNSAVDFPYASSSANYPLSFEARFRKIRGGNGITVSIPFESGNYYFQTCPTVDIPASLGFVCGGIWAKQIQGGGWRYQLHAYSAPNDASYIASSARGRTYNAAGGLTGNALLAADGDTNANSRWAWDGGRFDGTQITYFKIESFKLNTDSTSANYLAEIPSGVTGFVPLQEDCGNWSLQVYSGVYANPKSDNSPPAAYVELGQSAWFDHAIFNMRANTANGFASGVESNYDIDNPGAGTSGDIYYNVRYQNPGDVPGNGEVGIGPFITSMPGDNVGLLGQNYCQRLFVNPSQKTNGVLGGGQVTSDAKCVVAVGGKTGVSTGSDKTVVEQQDTVAFSIATSTSSFHAANGYPGYTTACRYYITTQVNNASGVSRSAEQSCDQGITATGTLTATVAHTVPTGPGSRVCLVARMTNVVSVASPGGNGNLASEPLGTEHAACVDVVSKPYFKVYGGDITAGNGFAGSGACINNSASIIGWNRLNNDSNPANSYRGSGVQYATYAQNVIRGVASAQGIGQAPVVPAYATAPSGLAFANTENLNPGNEVFGGRYAAGDCAPDFYGSMPAATNVWQDLQAANQLAQSDPSKGVVMLRSTHDTILRGESENSTYKLAQGTNAKLYIDGNLYINSNITAEQGMTSVDKIPGLTVIVRGNIYVGANVTELYGTYVAQPNATRTAGGTIYTCAYASGTSGREFAGQELYSNCGNRLAVTGSFVAEKLHLMRTRSSMTWDRTGNAVSGDSAANASEVFYYNPLSWLRQSLSSAADAQTDVIYDAITTLPPIL